ncbi:hypothetical protein YPC_2568 [Yersinia pestis biovar Medievalis str. Harbin 35]|nr:hypothetical protein YPC_2568 [Yersinia pestis biovar Medievalis str. Harbin 35]EEO76499.1 hypothetical protein YP516_2708 [Yersinia pestis Nepal516]EEO81343.1 hypothetical protein YPF_2062 [Yersinia pestis biovar Orientalis str. India 195]EEO87974.1 hypothetical protein YPH_3948 [Yersinia pestis biovar Orientalis str. PEXU2]EEO90637.1 hypothetical protein YPS_1994 [Yersinia pestis Pestoides A]
MLFPALSLLLAWLILHFRHHYTLYCQRQLLLLLPTILTKF